MDPNACLADIRQLIAKPTMQSRKDQIEIAEKVQALDDWLTRGGFLPSSWRTRPPHERRDVREQWCPECKSYHAGPVAEMTDAGRLTLACATKALGRPGAEPPLATPEPMIYDADFIHALRTLCGNYGEGGVRSALDEGMGQWPE